MARVLSGVQPSGSLHLGNYLGAFRQWVQDQYSDEAFFCVVDLHTMTTDISPDTLRERSLETAMGFLAIGLDPEVCTIFLQSHVPEHTELSWILECSAGFGELRRMTQFKEKSPAPESVRVGLFTYPVLMAADVLPDTDHVPVGDDQRQHLELTRDLALRFNARYGETFVVPEVTLPTLGARAMDLQHADKKMSKSTLRRAGDPRSTTPPTRSEEDPSRGHRHRDRGAPRPREETRRRQLVGAARRGDGRRPEPRRRALPELRALAEERHRRGARRAVATGA